MAMSMASSASMALQAINATDDHLRRSPLSQSCWQFASCSLKSYYHFLVVCFLMATTLHSLNSCYKST